MFLFFRCKRLTINPTSYIFNSPSAREKLIIFLKKIHIFKKSPIPHHIYSIHPLQEKKSSSTLHIFSTTKKSKQIINYTSYIFTKTNHQSHIIYFQKKSSITRHIFSIPPPRKKTSHKCSLEHQVMAATNCWTSSLNVKLTENFDPGPKSTYFV